MARGGIPVAREIADTLGLGAVHPFCTGWVKREEGRLFVTPVGGPQGLFCFVPNEGMIPQTTDPEVHEGSPHPACNVQERLEALRTRHTLYSGGAALEITPKVLLVDDGWTSGKTAIAAVAFVRHLGAQEVTVVAPVTARWTKTHYPTFNVISFRTSTLDRPAAGMYFHIGGFEDLTNEQVLEALRR